ALRGLWADPIDGLDGLAPEHVLGERELVVARGADREAIAALLEVAEGEAPGGVGEDFESLAIGTGERETRPGEGRLRALDEDLFLEGELVFVLDGRLEGRAVGVAGRLELQLARGREGGLIEPMPRPLGDGSLDDFALLVDDETQDDDALDALGFGLRRIDGR